MKFKKEEVLERLHYLDTMLDDSLDEEPTTEENFLKLVRNIRTRLETADIDQVRAMEKEVDEDGERWMIRRKNTSCKKMEISPDLCCADDFHTSMDGITTPNGMLLSLVLKKKNEEMTRRIESAKKNLDLSLGLDPIVVRPHKEGKLFEVIAGNHRVMAALSLGYKKIPVLCFCDNEDPNAVQDFIIQ